MEDREWELEGLFVVQLELTCSRATPHFPANRNGDAFAPPAWPRVSIREDLGLIQQNMPLVPWTKHANKPGCIRKILAENSYKGL